MENLKPLIDKLMHKHCNMKDGYDQMSIRSALLELAKIQEEKAIERIIQARIDERRRAKEIAYEFMRDHKQSYDSKTKAGYDLAFIENKIAEECRYIGNAISGLNALSHALKITMEDEVRKEVRIDQLSDITGLDKNIVIEAIYELEGGTLEEQLHWLKLNKIK